MSTAAPEPAPQGPAAPPGSRYVDGSYLDRNPDWHEGDAPWKAQKILQMITRHGLAPGSVCEVGCGSGEILRQLQGHLAATRFTGYDVSPQAIARCAPKANQGLEFRQGSPLGSGLRFDLLLLIDVMEHVVDPVALLRGLRDLSKDLILHIPLDLSAQGVLRQSPLLEARRTVGHIHSYTDALALEVLREAGWRTVDSFFTAGSLELPPRELRTRLAWLPRRLLYAASPGLCARLLGGCSLMVLAERDGA